MSKATVKSSDEDEGTGLLYDENSKSSALSSSSDSRNDDSPLVQLIDKTLTGKSKSKGKGKKSENTQGTKQDASEFVLACIYFFSPVARIDPQLLEMAWIVNHQR